jgi:hypothetical protein
MKYVLVVIVLIVLVAGGLFFLNSNSQPSPSTSNVASSSSNQTLESLPEGNSYVEYSNQALEESADKRRVLFFYANWCPTCIPADQNFQTNLDRIPSDVTLIRVNYNDDQTDEEENSLADKYGITYQHTFVQIDENGNEVTKWNGGQIDELLANLK